MCTPLKNEFFFVKNVHLDVRPINSRINNLTWPQGHYKYFLQNPQLTVVFYQTTFSFPTAINPQQFFHNS
jgi:hypothetical protein